MKIHQTMIKPLRLRMVKALIPCFSLLLLASLFSEINAQNVTGKVFRDFDASGQQTTASPALIEPGVSGVTVKAFNASGVQIGSAVQTAVDGTYTLSVATTNQVRIEFSNFPTAFFSGPKGTLSGTSVQFVNGGNTANLGINYPADYCGIVNPKLVTPCYANGTPLNGGNSANDPFIVTIPYSPTDDGVITPENSYLSKGSEVGATWGMAYQRSSKFIFASALLKRHSGFGNGGPGAIYKIDVSGGTQVTTLFTDLNADFAISAGTDPRNPLSAADSLSKIKTAPNRDSTAFGLVGKMSLGDIDISDDEKTLWVINTFNKKLYELKVGSPAVKPAASNVIAHTIPDPGCIKGVFRPWATKFWRGKIYVGGVCTAENGGDSTNLRAYIYSFIPGDANPNNFTEVFNFPLNYSRGYTSIGSATNKTSAAWRPWIAKWADITKPLPGAATYNQTIHPQPILSDIEFDVDGSMILGFMDRAGHQLGNSNYSPNKGDTKTYEGTAAGDLLRAGLNANGTYTLESNATVNGVVSGGTNQTPAQGPNGGEFYWQDMYSKSSNKNLPDGVSGSGHQEISSGGIALLLGKNEVVETVFDPVLAFRAGGVRWFNNTTGASPRGYQIFGTDANGDTFGKANGLGDLELLCNNQPIEVGNRLWNDINKNGLQDATEPALTGVTVQLWKNGVQVGANVTTDVVTGEYYFTGLIPNQSDYEIRIPNVNGVSKQAKLVGFDVTTANVGGNGNDLIDSDASIAGTNIYASIPFSTGNAGENVHTLDAGFSCVPPVAKPNGVVGDVKICDPTSTYTLPAAKTGVNAETWKVLTSPANSTAAITSAGLVTGMTINGKYTFVLTSNPTGCTDTVSITRSAIPMAGGDKSICSPATTETLNAAVNGQVWTVVSQPSGANAAIAANGNITAMSKDGVYTFRITEGSCFDEVQVIRKAKPNAGLDQTICSPTTTAQFADQGSGIWAAVISPANASAATIDSFGEVTGMTNTGIYQFALTTAGCSDTVKVVKKAGIIVTVTDTIRTCIGGNFTITTTTDAGAGAIYSWKGPNGFTSSQKDATLTNLVLASMGIYTLNVTSTTGCNGSATSDVILNDISVSLIAGKLNYCVGETIVLRTFNPEIGYKYDWTGPNGFTSINTLNISRPTTPDKSQAGLYSMLITSPNGCKAITTINISVTECLSIGNLVWDDSNNNGLNDNGEVGVGNVPVRLYKAKLDLGGFPTNVTDGATIQTTTTNSTTGKYLFSGLIPGYYIVEIDAPIGYKTSTGTNGSLTGTYEPAANPNSDVNDDDDGTKVSGQTITSKAIELGNYTEPTDDGDTVPTGSDADKNSNLTIDFGIFKPASLGDFVWADTNKNGIQDFGETGVANIIVKLYAATSITALATFTTLSDGKYLFDNLTPGTYTVEFVKTSIGSSNSFSPLAGVGSNATNDSNADPITGKSTPIMLIAGEFNQTIDAGIIGNCPGSTVGTITIPNLCVGGSLTMQAISSDPLATYSWTSTNSFTATTQSVTIPNLATTNAGTYTVLITNSNLCTSALTANVVVNPLPTLANVAGTTICEGSTATLSASGATTYSWVGPNNYTSTLQNPTIPNTTSVNAGVYTVTGVTNGCSAIALATLVIDKKPVPTATGAAICLGGNGTISVLPAGLMYVWTGPANFSSNQQSPLIQNATSTNAGTYTILVTDSKGCTATATTTVTVGNSLSITATSNSPVCSGTRLELSANGGTGATYLWTSPSGITTNLANPFTNNATAADNGTWIVAVTNIDGCKGIGSTNVVINPALIAGADKVICSPISTISLLSLNGGQSWRYFANGSSLPIPTIIGSNVTGISQDGNYLFILEQTGNSYCADTILVTRKASPNAGTDQVGLAGGICESETTAQLQAAGLGQTWSVASNSVDFGVATINATGKVNNLFKIGKYLFVLTQGQCTDTVIIERKASPVFDATMLQATCTTGAANADAKLSISGLDLTNKYDYSEGSIYIGTKSFATASVINATTVMVTLANPVTDKNYTVRVFNPNGCYTDKTVILKTRICECKPDVCIPYSFKKTKYK